MAFVRKNYRDIVEDLIAQITRGIVKEKHDYVLNRTKFKLGYTPVKEIVKVEGQLNGTRHIFQEDIDYTLSGDMLEWLDGGEKPDDKTPFYVNYIFGNLNPDRKITDVNPGSVMRNIVEAIGREIDFLYAQIEQVYLSGFIDTATGSALDLVVSILGVNRKPPQYATGKVTFGRETDPPEIPAEPEVHLFDGRIEYQLKAVPVKSITQIKGVLQSAQHNFELEKDFILEDDNVVWLPDGQKPDLNSEFRVEYVAYQRITIPLGTNISTFSREPQNIRMFVTTAEGVLERTEEGKWEAEVPVKAAVAGRFGNAPPGAVTVMPQPPIGVEYVINRGDVSGGVEAEGDDELRERAKHALEKIGKATLISIESAVRGVEGVRSLLIEDMPEGIPGMVKVVVQGGDTTELERVIEDTRAAGIKVELLRPKIVYLDVSLTITLTKGASASMVRNKVEEKIRGYVSSLKIGEDVLFNKIVFMALNVEGVRDVTDVKIKAYHKEAEVLVTVKENIRIAADELAEPRIIDVSVKG
ncbi:MAG: baseplate J/gp47 family protein [archaeon]|nr:baseplate J/gp47 family protein [archaeon]MCP8319934.1 baseplate J/gp47 family protein [archaeon]